MSDRERFTLSWSFPDSKTAVLRFDKTTWAAMQRAGKREGRDAEEMISVAVARLVGSINNYRLRE